MAFDLVVAAILLFTTIRGAAKGVAWQLAGIGALVLCFLFATPLSLSIAPMIKLAPPLNRWVAMLGIYLVFSFGTFTVARGFREALEKAKFVEFDRHLGALFGLAKGAIFVLVATFFMVAMSAQARQFVLTTYTGYAAAHIMDAIDPIMPNELHAILEPYIHELDAVDPELERRREERDQQLTDLDETDPDGIRRPTAGYRPLGTENGIGGPNDDPFVDESGAAQPPGYAPNQAAPTLAQEAQQFLESLPNLTQKIAPAIKQQILSAFQNTAEEHRQEFAEQLRRAPNPDQMSAVARNWQRGRPKRPVRPAVGTSPARDGALDPFGFTSSDRPVPRVPGKANRPVTQSPINQPAINQLPVEQPVIDQNEPSFEEPVADLQPRRQELLQGIARVYSSQAAQQAKKMTEVETLMLGLPDQVSVGVLEDWLSDLRGEDPDPDPQTDITSGLNDRIAHQLELRRIPRSRLPQEWQSKLESYNRN